MIFPAFGTILVLVAAFFFSKFNLNKYSKIDFSSFWHDLVFGGSFFLFKIELKKYSKIVFSSFWHDLGFGGSFFLFKIEKKSSVCVSLKISVYLHFSKVLLTWVSSWTLRADELSSVCVSLNSSVCLHFYKVLFTWVSSWTLRADEFSFVCVSLNSWVYLHFYKVLFTRVSSWTLRFFECSTWYLFLCLSEIFVLPVFFLGFIVVGLKIRMGGVVPPFYIPLGPPILRSRDSCLETNLPILSFSPALYIYICVHCIKKYLGACLGCSEGRNYFCSLGFLKRNWRSWWTTPSPRSRCVPCHAIRCHPGHPRFLGFSWFPSAGSRWLWQHLHGWMWLWKLW